MRDGDKDESEKYYPSESERVRIGGRIEEGEGWELMPMVASALIDIFEGSDKGRQEGVGGRGWGKGSTSTASRHCCSGS